MKPFVLLAVALTLLPATPVTAAVPVSDFARPQQFGVVKISPDGEYLAATTKKEDRGGLVFIRLADLKVTGTLPFSRHEQVYDFDWVGDHRVVASVAMTDGSLERPYATGELVGIDADGEHYAYLYGYRRGAATGRQTTYPAGAASIINPLPIEAGRAIIAVDYFDRSEHEKSSIFSMNVNTGHLDEMEFLPVERAGRFVTDSTGFLRYFVAFEAADRTSTYSRTREQKGWKNLNVDARKGDGIYPIAMSKDDKYIYLKTNSRDDRYCLVREDASSAERKELACDDVADLAETIFTFDKGEPIAALFEGGKPVMHFLETNSPDRDLLLDLIDSFPNQLVLPVSATRDGSKAVIKIFSDRNPGEFYLLDTKTGKAKYLISSRSWIKPDQMAEVRPISYKSRDGKTIIHGFLTLPPGTKDPKDLPLIVNPHGGPFDIRDKWGWDTDPQLLASRGYAVLQMNFRGSGGYGSNFRDSGKYGWGTVMIDDITDGTRWMIAQGYADPKRVCIYGGSYGGYAALMSAVREPSLYRCTVGYAGVYDLELQTHTSDTAQSEYGRDYFKKFLAHDDEELRAQSPLTYLDNLKAAVLIVHGEEDKRVPLSQANRLMAALDERKYPYEKLIKAKEGHGFYNPKNLEELYDKLLTFFDKNIGSSSVNSTP